MRCDWRLLAVGVSAPTTLGSDASEFSAIRGGVSFLSAICERSSAPKLGFCSSDNKISSPELTAALRFDSCECAQVSCRCRQRGSLRHSKQKSADNKKRARQKRRKEIAVACAANDNLRALFVLLPMFNSIKSRLFCLGRDLHSMSELRKIASSRFSAIKLTFFARGRQKTATFCFFSRVVLCLFVCLFVCRLIQLQM